MGGRSGLWILLLRPLRRTKWARSCASVFCVLVRLIGLVLFASSCESSSVPGDENNWRFGQGGPSVCGASLAR